MPSVDPLVEIGDCTTQIVVVTAVPLVTVVIAELKVVYWHLEQKTVEVEVATSVWVLVDAGAGAGEEANVAQLGAASTRTTLVNGTTTVPIIVDSTIV